MLPAMSHHRTLLVLLVILLTLAATASAEAKVPVHYKVIDGFAANGTPTDLNKVGIVKTGRVTCSPMVLSYDGVYLWKACVEKAGSFDVDKVREAWKSGVSFDGPGGKVTTQSNMHLTKNVYIGETKADGQFKILKSFANVYGEPWLKGKFK